ncbi:MAG: isocitrate lyase/PEP mutase family protein [Acidimicrobiales bacterium]
MTLTDTFRSLHQEGIFVMPNPWDRGSARILQDLGFKALATTSAGLGRSIGKADQQVTRAELVTHVGELTSILDVPLNVDSERLFPDAPGGIAETVRLLAEAGASGCSIEDYRPSTSSIVPIAEAADAVGQAAAACGEHGIVLTARCENLLYGVGDLDDTIARLIAYREAGAEVVYPPGLVEAADITRVVTEVGAPVNVLNFPGAPPVDQLATLGVRRVSTGGALYNTAYRAMRHEAEALLALQPD